MFPCCVWRRLCRYVAATQLESIDKPHGTRCFHVSMKSTWRRPSTSPSNTCPNQVATLQHATSSTHSTGTPCELQGNSHVRITREPRVNHVWTSHVNHMWNQRFVKWKYVCECFLAYYDVVGILVWLWPVLISLLQMTFCFLDWPTYSILLSHASSPRHPIPIWSLHVSLTFPLFSNLNLNTPLKFQFPWNCLRVKVTWSLIMLLSCHLIMSHQSHHSTLSSSRVGDWVVSTISVCPPLNLVSNSFSSFAVLIATLYSTKLS